jgi:single-strand DNA-binding protein
MNINTIHITGNLTEDPERRFTPSGKAVVSASIANNEHYTDAQGEEKKVTTFVNLQIWGKPAENFGNLVKKGQEIFVDGKLRMDEWTDKQTNTRRTRLYLLVENWQFTQYRRKEESIPEAPTPALSPGRRHEKGQEDWGRKIGNEMADRGFDGAAPSRGA